MNECTWECGCGKIVDTIQTIDEWCKQLEINDDDLIKKAHRYSEENHCDTDICEDCFSKIITECQKS